MICGEKNHIDPSSYESSRYIKKTRINVESSSNELQNIVATNSNKRNSILTARSIIDSACFKCFYVGNTAL
jgi:hypothetical protein